MRYSLIFLIMFVVNYGFAQQEASVNLIENHIKNITKTKEYRNYSNINQLNKIADYIKTEFVKSSDNVSFQEYIVDGKMYKNVIASFGIENNKRIIIGAHYDVCGNQEGADDNASGVVGLLELSRMLKKTKLNYRIDLVAYTLEEPPFFRTENMGSYIHAKSLVKDNVNVYGMISLEMIGYFSNEENSQFYPDPRLELVYGNKGDFITVVNKSKKKQFAIDFGSSFKENAVIKTIVFDSEPNKQSIDYSDHLNYWKFGFSAVMITDTAFLRNKNYHKKTDVLDTLNLDKMSKVINAVYKGVISL